MKETITNSTQFNDLTLILGGTGKTGRKVAEYLGERGISTRIASRSMAPFFDWNERSTWAETLNGVTAAYITYAPDLAIPGATESIRDFVKQAVEQGVQRLVLLSGRGEEEAQLCERIVQKSGVEWTVVRASWFNQNFSEGEFLSMVQEGVITLPASDIPEPFVDVDDIAEVVVTALVEDGHNGETYVVTGPRMLTFSEVAQEISLATEREIQFLQIPREDFTAGVTQSGAPKEIVWLLDYLFKTVLDGRNAYVCDGVRRALGREPTDFSEYAHRIAATGVWKVAAEKTIECSAA